jgi:hypothetical protein
MLLELGKLDLARVHFVGRIEYHDYLNLLRSLRRTLLTHRVRLSCAFEAMASGCRIVAPRPCWRCRRRHQRLSVDFFLLQGARGAGYLRLAQPARCSRCAMQRARLP